jgi:hypothetical protein
MSSLFSDLQKRTGSKPKVQSRKQKRKKAYGAKSGGIEVTYGAGR